MLCSLFSLILLSGLATAVPVPVDSESSEASGYYHKYHNKYPAPPKYSTPPKYYAPPPPKYYAPQPATPDYSNYGSYGNYEGYGGHEGYGKYESQNYAASQVEASYPAPTAPSYGDNYNSYGSYGSYGPEHPHGYEYGAKAEDSSQ